VHNDRRRVVRNGSSSAPGDVAELSEGGSMDWSFGDLIVSAIVLFWWFAFIWVFIAVFGDLFRRDDLTGTAKALWILLIVVLPFLGLVVYVIVRPVMTEQDRRLAARMLEGRRGPRA
jgi:Phospholipase_D-nuclease N-terminal